MSPVTLGAMESKVRPIVGSIRSTGVPAAQKRECTLCCPFVTISRQAGAGGRSLAGLLAARLNTLDPGERPWEAFDRELVEKVAADYRISEQLIESLGESSTNWLQEFFGGLSHRDKGWASETEVFHRVAATVRALAQAGRVILVGRGAGYVTQNMKAGVHIRLVARLNHRIAALAKLEGLDLDQAAARVRELDHNREVFFKRYFPNKLVSSSEFTMTLNSSFMSEEEMVSAIVPVVLARRPGTLMTEVPVVDVAGPAG